MRTLSILYQDKHLVAVNKPSGLLVHKSFIDRRETEYAMKVLRDQLGQWVYPVHRLDKATSGVLVFALDPETARSLMLSFTDGAVAKSYLAVVRGFSAEAERIESPLKDIWDPMTDRRANRDKQAREAVTEYRRLATVELPHAVGRYTTARFSLLEVWPKSGRMHQIRRHLKHVFHPVIGDTTYGDGRQNDFFRTQFGSRRLLLHAREISFPHPSSTGEVRIVAPLDDGMNALFRRLSWEAAVPGREQRS